MEDQIAVIYACNEWRWKLHLLGIGMWTVY